MTWIQGDSTQGGAWQEQVSACEVVFNFAGAPIFHRWTPRYKELIRSSRVQTTERIVEAMASSSAGAPRRLISASAVGFYGGSGDDPSPEDSAQGSDFLARVCGEWEAAALSARAKGIRVILPRFGVVLGRSGGAFRTLRPVFQMGLGGSIGNGRQWFPWIHLDDAVSALGVLMESPEADGPVNLCAPEPVTNREFTRALGRAMRRPALLPAPSLLVRMILGEFGSSLLEGRRVIPRRLMELGFAFQYPALESALRNLVAPPV